MRKYIVDTRKKPFVVNRVKVIEIKDMNLICVDNYGNKFTVSKGNYFNTEKEAVLKLEEIVYIGIYKTKNRNSEDKSWSCAYCGKKMFLKHDVTVDHIIPRSRGGRTNDGNLVICCKRCNGLKSSKNKSHYQRLLDVNSKKKLGNSRRCGEKIRYSAHTKHGDNMEHIARMDGRYISVNYISKHRNMVDVILENEKRRKEGK